MRERVALSLIRPLINDPRVSHLPVLGVATQYCAEKNLSIKCNGNYVLLGLHLAHYIWGHAL